MPTLLLEYEHLGQWLVLAVLLLISSLRIVLHFFPTIKKYGQQQRSVTGTSCGTCHGCSRLPINTSITHAYDAASVAPSTKDLKAFNTRDDVLERQISHVCNTEKSSLIGQAATEV